MWLKLAAKNDYEDAKYDLAVTEGKLTKDQIAEAERLAREWLVDISADSDGARYTEP